MLQLLQSESTAARRRIPIYMVSSTDGYTPVTSITFAEGDIKISKNGAAEANHTGSVSEIAGGLYYYEATTAELDTLGFLTLRFSATNARVFIASVQVTANDPYTTLLDLSNGIETSLTLKQALRLICSVVFGKSTVTNTGVGTAIVRFRDNADTKDRITADMSGSARITVTKDAT